MVRSDLFRRLAVAAVGVPAAILVVTYGGWVLTAAVGLIAVLATLELNALVMSRGVRPFAALGVLGSLALVLLAGWTQSFSAWAPWAMAAVILLFFLSSASAVRFRAPEDRPLLVASLTLTGAIYWGGCVSFAVFLRHLPDVGNWPDGPWANPGAYLLAFPCAVTWTADTAAYLIGNLIGKRKLAPSVSPGKTLEGAAAGLLAAVLTGAFMGWFFLKLGPDPLIQSLVGGGMGLVMGVSIQVGDLIESLFKREAGVKDSGSLLPGHGGILDRFDALIFTLPLTYALISLWSALS